jgi:hypothetical protein
MVAPKRQVQRLPTMHWDQGSNHTHFFAVAALAAFYAMGDPLDSSSEWVIVLDFEFITNTNQTGLEKRTRACTAF